MDVSWLMCRNPACKNFGHPFVAASGITKPTVVSDDRYRIDLNLGHIHCKYCGISFGVKSNQAIRPLVRYFLGLSLPFGDCPNEDCANHGYNVFEHFRSDVMSRGQTHKGLSLYRKQSDHRVACRQCEARFYLGNPLHLKSTKRVGEILQGWREQRSTAITIETTNIPTSSYYSHLHRIGARLRDWHAYQNAQLLKGKYENWDRPIRAYTDTIRISLQRAGEGRRTQYLNIVTTVIGPGPSYFVLAAHPNFLPRSHCPEFPTLLSALSDTKHRYEWDCLDFGFGTRPTAKVREMSASLSDVGRDGYFSNSPYTELAHFLVVSKLLSRFPKIHLYIDGSVPLYSSVLTAFASDIQTGRVEIVLFQHLKDPKRALRKKTRSPARGDSDKSRQLEEAWHRMIKDLAQRTHPESASGSLNHEWSQQYAKVFKISFKGAFSKNGAWAWLPFPPSSDQYEDPRSLWLTWNSKKEFERSGRDLLLLATLQPVDSAFSSFRRRGRGMHRASSRAMPGRSYVEAYAEPHERHIGTLDSDVEVQLYDRQAKRESSESQ